MKNQLLPQVTGIPFNSVAYSAERTPKRQSLEYRSQHHELASRGSQKTTPNKLERMSRIAQNLTRNLMEGGVERIFKYNFNLMEGEKILKASQSFLSTTADPIAGILFISTEKVAFCSEKSIELSSPIGKVIRIPYKVSIPIEKMLRANESQSLKKTTRKYIEILTQDNFEFWFMGFTNCRRTLKYLQQVITQTQCNEHSQIQCNEHSQVSLASLQQVMNIQQVF